MLLQNPLRRDEHINATTHEKDRQLLISKPLTLQQQKKHAIPNSDALMSFIAIHKSYRSTYQEMRSRALRLRPKYPQIDPRRSRRCRYSAPHIVLVEVVAIILAAWRKGATAAPDPVDS
jgi:hypothetical protein